MKCNLEVELYDEAGKEQYGGTNRPIATLVIRNLEIIPYRLALEQFLIGNIRIGCDHNSRSWYCNVKNNQGDFKYSKEINLFLGRAILPSNDPGYIQHLIRKGWEFTPEFLSKHIQHP